MHTEKQKCTYLFRPNRESPVSGAITHSHISTEIQKHKHTATYLMTFDTSPFVIIIASSDGTRKKQTKDNESSKEEEKERNEEERCIRGEERKEGGEEVKEDGSKKGEVMKAKERTLPIVTKTKITEARSEHDNEV